MSDVFALPLLLRFGVFTGYRRYRDISYIDLRVPEGEQYCHVKLILSEVT